MYERYQRFSLARQYRVASLLVLLASMLVIGAWVAQQIEERVVNRTGAITALYVESALEPYLQPLATRPHLDADAVAALDRLLVETRLGERIVAFKVWSPDGEVLYSPNRELIGRRFPVEGGLARALLGEVPAHLSNLKTPENEYERTRWNRLLEVYVPVRARSEPIIAVTEFYQPVEELEGEMAAARLRSWAVVAGVMLVTYLLLAGIVKQGSDTIVTQQAALRQQVVELSQLLEQNARLHERVRLAAGRTTALNEQALRRVSADLHDGPGQALALALLRLDTLESCSAACGLAGDTFTVVHRAVQDAMEEMRTIAAGLRLPQLARLSLLEIAERAIADHERRSGTEVALQVQHLPEQAPLPIKIALFRTLQEALSNATRHAGGLGVTVRVWAEAERVCLAVSDRGPGFVVEQVQTNGHLGLVGMQEQAELLGGSFRVESAPGRGTTVQVHWPLEAMEEAWAS